MLEFLAVAALWHLDYQVMDKRKDLAKTLDRPFATGVFTSKAECVEEGKAGVIYFRKYIPTGTPFRPEMKFKYTCKLRKPVVKTPAQLEEIHNGHHGH